MSEITYTLEIISLQKRLDNGVIDKIKWSKIGTAENGISASFGAYTHYNNVDASNESFIAFDDLTEEIVKDWIQNEIQYQTCDSAIEERMAVMMEGIAELNKLNISRSIISSESFPWAT